MASIPTDANAPPAATDPGRRSRARLFALAVLFALGFAAVAVRLAWVGDDAYITLRCVENWVRGNGLRWNVADRVQVYTHPLWMLVLALGRAVTGEVFHTAITIGVALSTAAVAWLLFACRSAVAVVLVGLVAVTAHAFGDYATSGLETALTYLLVVAFARAADGAPSPRRLLVVALLAALAATNRMDLALLVTPGLLAAMRGLPWRTRLARTALGAVPFAAWLAFATIYYGSPFPVTAHAKAFGLGIPGSELFVQGLRYLWHAVAHDPVLPAVIALGFVLGLRERATRWLALGIPLYVGYVLRVGGDFMQGRFLLPPFVLALWFVARAGRLPAVLLALPLLGAVLAPPHWLRSPADDPVQLTPEAIDAAHGIVDERCAYYATQGLWSPALSVPEWGAMNRFPIVWPEERTQPWIAVGGAIGVFGYTAGALGHLVDPLLCDPLMARLPAHDPRHWRIGHVLRRIPEGYLESLASGENRVVHPGLRRYCEALRTATTALVFAAERWRALWALWTGELDADLASFVAEHYRTPPRVAVPRADAASPVEAGRYWFDEPNAKLVHDGGVAIAFGAPVEAREVHLHISGLVVFHLTFRRGGATVGTAEVRPAGNALEMQRLQPAVVAVPAGAGAFDELWLDVAVHETSHFAVTRSAFGGLELRH